ncbi:hypothetical protein C6502_13305 [Candidatus Poribacteria bacterium]|nr:MAG: hypothetical protein C6502_13305 [Candidatus Poribacteria bacterium]
MKAYTDKSLMVVVVVVWLLASLVGCDQVNYLMSPLINADGTSVSTLSWGGSIDQIYSPGLLIIIGNSVQGGTNPRITSVSGLPSWLSEGLPTVFSSDWTEKSSVVFTGTTEVGTSTISLTAINDEGVTSSTSYTLTIK